MTKKPVEVVRALRTAKRYDVKTTCEGSAVLVISDNCACVFPRVLFASRKTGAMSYL